MKLLSTVIITYNEESNIERCIRSVFDISNEVLIVDSYSTDNTVELAKSLGARVIQHEFEGHIQQKNYALSQAANDTCLSLDADEELSSVLKSSIKRALSEWHFSGYRLNRLTNYCGKWIKHGGWYPDRKIRLFDRRKGEWKGENPHDRYEIEAGESVGKLKGDLNHYSFTTIEQHDKQIEYFTDLAANAAITNDKKSSGFKIWIKPKFKFFRDYFLRLGFLDGKFGYLIAKKSAHATYLKYKKMKQLQS